MLIHLGFDLTAYALALLLAVAYRRRGESCGAAPVPADMRLAYYLVLTNGVIAGSLLFGSANLWLSGHGLLIGKSILGAIVGGVIAVELFKLRTGLRGSTGAALVPALALGIFVGRWGCFYAGLDDHTHGLPTSLATAVDFGDGVPRHPVQLYEAFTMLAFFLVAATLLWRGSRFWWRQGFYVFVMFYGLQRFAWEFLKPYERSLAGLNIFHWLSLGLVIYGAVLFMRGREERYAGNVT